jgi:hypothetical protein
MHDLIVNHWNHSINMVCKETFIVYCYVVLELSLIYFKIWVVLKNFETLRTKL